MALSDLPGRIAARYQTLTPGPIVRLQTADYRADLEAAASEEIRYQLRVTVVARNFNDSNLRLYSMGVEIEAFWKLRNVLGLHPDFQWTEQVLLPHMESLTDRNWWTAIEGVTEIQEVESTVERVGHVMKYLVSATITANAAL